MVEQTQRPWVRQNPSSCLTQCQTEKKVFANSESVINRLKEKFHKKTQNIVSAGFYYTKVK